jgi:hypothetical protein
MIFFVLSWGKKILDGYKEGVLKIHNKMKNEVG